MANETLLELVQGILSDIDGDEVNSISDTVEAETVARHIKHSFDAITNSDTWQSSRRALTLKAHSDNSLPTHMSLQDNVKELISVYYDNIDAGETRKRYKLVKYLSPDQFLVKTNARDNDQTDTEIVNDPSGVVLLIKNDKHPEYFTSFNDTDLIFDSYKFSVDDSLQISKVQALGFIVPTLSIADSTVPDLPPDAMSFLREDATARCQFKMRQMQDIPSAQSAAGQKRTLSRKNWRVDGGIKFPNYGRKGRR